MPAMPLAEHPHAAPSPRQERELVRIGRAAAAAHVGPAPAGGGAAQIGAAFDEAAAINAFKLRVERLIRLGPHHPAVRARFGGRADLLFGRSLDAAIAAVERWWRDERKAFAIASALGCGSRLSLEILGELRLILRLLRLKRMQAEFGEIIATLCEVPIAAAAE